MGALVKGILHPSTFSTAVIGRVHLFLISGICDVSLRQLRGTFHVALELVSLPSKDLVSVLTTSGAAFCWNALVNIFLH